MQKRSQLTCDRQKQAIGVEFSLPADNCEDPDLRRDCWPFLPEYHSGDAFSAAGLVPTEVQPDCAPRKGIGLHNVEGI